MLLSLDLACDESAPRHVRDALTKMHTQAWSLDDGLLVASELVTNAVRHSGGSPHHRLRVVIALEPDALEISVYDPGLSGRDAEPLRKTDDPGGWGLRIIEQVTVRWGQERPDGYRVWAELPVCGA
jgi:anti-sigma regulatory factor (Ser/Thr protein kinase)